MKGFKLTPGMRSYLIQQIQQMDLSEPKRVDIKDWSGKRSLSSNGLQHVWYNQIADFCCTDFKTAKAESKIDHGLPIILSDPTHGAVIDWKLKAMDFYSRSREAQVKIICTESVTSLFNTKQANQYMNSLQVFWGSCGLNLSNE